MKRTAKEYSIDLNEHFESKYGTVNKNNPKVIYLTWKSWISPQFNGDYKTPLQEVRKNLQSQIKTAILNSSSFENDFIMESDFKFAQLGKREKNFLTIELFVKQKHNYKLEEFRGEIINTFKSVLDKCTSEIISNNFILTKSKKG